MIFFNLLDNAFMHTKPNKVPTIVMSSETMDQTVIVCVSDDATGIASAKHDRIFDPLFSSKRSDHEFRPGMGLTIARKIARLHGGDVWVDSEPDRGSKFYVRLPIVASEWVS